MDARLTSLENAAVTLAALSLTKSETLSKIFYSSQCLVTEPLMLIAVCALSNGAHAI